MATTPDGERIRQLFEERSGLLLRFLRRINVDRPHIAEDLLQETMLRVWRHLGTMPATEEHLQPWLLTIARNVSADEARRRRRRPPEAAFEGLEARAEPGDPMAVVVATESMLAAFRNLSDGQRRALRDIHLNGRSAADTGRDLQVPAGTVKSRAHYAMRSLRTAILDN
ncbi:sigma-70 family RNA polymerase sigma factor [Actinoplanes sp. HUAS TT8]|uniref:sigma-70 family RNA polymerase sigma factor n=1 Tax=Actinoplanes sp. HUAS TT8 TaxID=3447453 RepID=UPI003F52769D